MSDQWPPPPSEPPPYGGPPYGQPPGQPMPGPLAPGQQEGSQPPQAYPQQQLLPQVVQPGRSRVPLIIGLVVVLALVGGGAAAWLLLRDDGESTRAAYCSALKELTHDGDLLTTVSVPTANAAEQLDTVIKLAPDAVAGDWEQLQTVVSSATGSTDLDTATILNVFAALRGIVSDADSKCDLTIELPGL